MGTFEEDVEYDVENSFTDTSGNGLATTVTYKVASTGVSTSDVPAVVEEQFYAVFDDREVQRFHISAADVASPQRNDQITHDGDTWTVVDIRPEGPELNKLTCARTYGVT